MHIRYRVFILAALLTLGAGCTTVPSAQNITPTSTRVTINMNYSPLCISFKDRQGFENWVKAYEAGDPNGIMLARNLYFPDQAEPLFLQQLRDSMTTGTTPTFLCSLDERATIRTWMVEDDEPANGACRAVNTLRILGDLRVADVTTDGRDWDCKGICEPKYQNRDALVWQCDVRTTNDGATWTELHMSRLNGETRTYGCKEDRDGVTPGCVR